MEFIDTHQHLIWRKRLGYAWTADIPVLASGDFLPQDYLAGVAGLGVVGSLFMEAGVDDADYQAEARHVASEVGRHGILGQIASCRPERPESFEAWLDECADLKVHGLRRILHVVPDEVSQSDGFRANLRKIGKRGWTFDMCYLARQLPIAANLARACPDQVLVLDHCGVPDIAGGAFAPWAEGIMALAKLPNVMVKLSGIAAYCTPGTVTLETLRPWVDHVLQSFGPGRMVWGSDWPVVLIGTELRNWLVLTRELLAGLSDDERALIGHRNARRIYRLEG